MNSCPGSGRLGSSPICHLPSDIGNRGSFLCLGMNGRLLPMNSEVAFLGYSIVREPRVQVYRPFASPFSFFFFLGLLLIFLFVVSAQLRSVQSSRAGTRGMQKQLLNMPKRSTTSTIWLIREPWLVTTWVQSLPPTSCTALRLKRRVSVHFVRH